MEEWKNRLKKAREGKNLTKTEFAKAIGVSNPTVTDWEKSSGDGGIKEINGTNLTMVCKVLEISPQWLLYGKETPQDHIIKTIEAENKSKKKEFSELDDMLLFIEAYKKSSPSNRKILMRSVKTAIELSESSTASHKSRIFKNQA